MTEDEIHSLIWRKLNTSQVGQSILCVGPVGEDSLSSKIVLSLQMPTEIADYILKCHFEDKVKSQQLEDLRACLSINWTGRCPHCSNEITMNNQTRRYGVVKPK